jgi:hypothetical protein
MSSARLSTVLNKWLFSSLRLDANGAEVRYATYVMVYGHGDELFEIPGDLERGTGLRLLCPLLRRNRLRYSWRSDQSWRRGISAGICKP